MLLLASAVQLDAVCTGIEMHQEHPLRYWRCVIRLVGWRLDALMHCLRAACVSAARLHFHAPPPLLCIARLLCTVLVSTGCLQFRLCFRQRFHAQLSLLRVPHFDCVPLALLRTTTGSVSACHRLFHTPPACPTRCLRFARRLHFLL